MNLQPKAPPITATCPAANTSRSEADKAIHSLKVIILGTTVDKHVSDEELAELRHWSKKHFHLVNRNPFREFMLTIRAAAPETKADDRVELIENHKPVGVTSLRAGGAAKAKNF